MKINIFLGNDQNRNSPLRKISASSKFEKTGIKRYHSYQLTLFFFKILNMHMKARLFTYTWMQFFLGKCAWLLSNTWLSGGYFLTVFVQWNSQFWGSEMGHWDFYFKQTKNLFRNLSHSTFKNINKISGHSIRKSFKLPLVYGTFIKSSNTHMLSVKKTDLEI